ncbi:MAG: hypothetical protein ACI4PF_04010 [Christensenellales bacterium]
MKAFRITMLVLLSLIDAYCLYATIGYLIIGIQTPKIIGNTTTVFTGMFIMSGMFLLFTLIATTLIIIIAIKLRKKNKQK